MSGSKPWVTIGCRFAKDSEGTPPDGEAPKPKSYYKGLIGAVASNQSPAEPGMDLYWRELSFNKIDLTGSQVGRQDDLIILTMFLV